MKSIITLVCLVALALASSAEARPKRSVIVASAAVPVVASVATVPVVHSHQVVHNNPTTVVKTEQVRSGDHTSYTYSQEVKDQPVVHTHTHTHAAAVAPVATAAVAPVATAPVAVATSVHHTVPTYGYGYGYGYYPYAYYSPYASYIIGKK